MPYPPHYLFVYGTLRAGFTNPFARRLHQAGQFVGIGTLPGRLYELGNYPGMVYLSDHKTNVLGDIYSIQTHQSAILTFLDRYEGISNPPNPSDEYIRTVVPVGFNDNVLDCWVYLYNLDPIGKQLIKSGDYLRYCSPI